VGGFRLWTTGHGRGRRAQSQLICAIRATVCPYGLGAANHPKRALPPLLVERHVRHEQPLGHALPEVAHDVRLAPWDRDRPHGAIGGPDLDDVGPVVLRPVDHDPVLAGHHHDTNRNPIAPPMMAARITMSQRRWSSVSATLASPQ